MPEYSSTTITPADAIQLPAMNGSSGGNFTLASLKSYILSALGQANGIASLDGNGKLTSAQIPTDLDDVLVYAAYANYPATGVEGKLYIAKAEGTIHYWSGSAYVQVNTPLSQTVTSGDTTHAPSGDAVYQKVLTEQTARQNADSQLDKRVTNLEQKAGDYSETRYQNAPSGVVPSSKASYGIWTTQRGVTRGWNQLHENWTIGNTWRANQPGQTNTSSGTELTINASSSLNYPGIIYNKTLVASHVYLMLFSTKITSGGTTLTLSNGGSASTLLTMSSSYQLVSKIFTYSTGNIIIYCYSSSGTTDWMINNMQLVDLTLLFGGGNEPSTVAEALQRIPQLGQYNSYNAGSLVSNTVSGLTSIGVNLWDEEWETGSIDPSGQPQPSSTTIRSKNFIEVTPNTSYYLTSATTGGYIFFYDEDKNFISWVAKNNADFITTGNTWFVKFRMYDPNYGSTYKNDIQICLNSYSDKTTYHPYFKNTLSLASSVTLRSAGSVQDTLEPNVEVNGVAQRRDTQNVGTITLDGSDDESYSALSAKRYQFSVSNFSSPNSSIKANITCNLLTTSPKGNVEQADMQISAGDDGNSMMTIHIDSSITDVATLRTWLSTHNLEITYELKTPVVTLSDPVDNAIRTEADGTVTPVQTQTPTIDTDFTMGFLAV